MKTSGKILSTLLLATPMFACAGGAKPLVNINQDSAQEFNDDLTGVTQGIASNIVQYRNRNGDFSNKSQLLNVPGFGRDDLNINRNYMTMDKKIDRNSLDG